MFIEFPFEKQIEALPGFLVRTPCGMGCSCEMKEKKKKCCKKFKKGKRCGSCPKV
jgi:hypothetical protein